MALICAQRYALRHARAISAAEMPRSVRSTAFCRELLY